MVKNFTTLFTTLVSAALLVSGARRIEIVNKCPSTVRVFINGQPRGSISSNGASQVTTVPDNFSGFIYTDANGGSQSGTGTTRAGFYGQSSYYYLVTDPSRFNVEVSIDPARDSNNGFCGTASCSSAGCSTAFTSPPTRLPRPSLRPPNPPLYACPGGQNNNNGGGYTVTFCPQGRFPPTTPPVTQGVQLHPNNNKNKCLDVRGAAFQNGTPVQIYDCNGTGAQKWILTKGNTQVKVAGTNFCLDAGSSPGNGIGMKIWTCYNNLPAQEWYYTGDNRIALTGRGLCLDLTNGGLGNGNKVQTWQCTNNNNNQVWTV